MASMNGSSVNSYSEAFESKANTPKIAPRTRSAILTKVSTSRLTIIIGPTGSGKSTCVPPLLLDELGGPILVTQPRRLAVVAVSTRVANQRGVPLGGGGEVGYHVGQHNLSTMHTRLLFTTAGILLEELRANGIKKTFTKYKCVLVDECHERSPESDLCICLIKSFLAAHPESTTRFILMSATFHHAKYQQYFSQVCPDIDVITLETADSFQAHYNMVETLYLDDVVKMLPAPSSGHLEFLRKMRMHPNQDLEGIDGGKSLSNDMLRIIVALIRVLDREERQGAAFVIFAPTYRHLEQIHDALIYDSNTVHPCLHVLHSSVDIEDCLRTMQETHSHSRQRKILLASAIADSSVTIPGVTCAIDLCRALEVKWDLSKQAHAAKTVWASHSVCDQRRGRTGRTCPGRVFRLVTQGFYITQLQQWDTAQLVLSSCRDEMLKILCSSHSKIMSDPVLLLQKCLDPPPPRVLEDSLDYLKNIGACTLEQSRNKSRIVQTQYGTLLAALPFSVGDSKIVLAGAQLGLLHETLALRAICSHKPAPIVHHFGGQARNDECLRQYYPSVNSNDKMSVALANLSAYMYWDHEWNHKRRQTNRVEFEKRSQAGSAKADCGVWQWTERLDEEHIEWCRSRDINPTSVRAIAEIMDSVRNVLFHAQYEPEWLRCTDPTPLWKRRKSWKGYYSGQCLLWQVYGYHTAPLLCEALLALCESGGKVQSAILGAQAVAGTNRGWPLPATKRVERRPLACLHFLSGSCKFGDKCRNSHATDAIRPPCKFYKAGTCAKGRHCIFSHGPEFVHDTVDSQGNTLGDLSAIAPLIQSPILPMGATALDWFDSNEALGLFMLGEGDFSFTLALTELEVPPCYTSTIEMFEREDVLSILTGVDATRLHRNSRIQILLARNEVRCFAWNFPFTGNEEDVSGNESLILGTLHSLSSLLEDTLSETGKARPLLFGLTLQGDQFSRWSVLRSAERTGWRLNAWCPFDQDDFPGYHPTRANGERFPVKHARFYLLKYEHIEE